MFLSTTKGRDTPKDTPALGFSLRYTHGFSVATMKPPYGFSYNETKDGLTLNEPEMAIVESIFHMAAGGAGTKIIQGRLYELAYPCRVGAGRGAGTS